MSKRIITFGKWEDKPIEWIVLDEDEYQTFVVSRYPLFSHVFNLDSNKGNQWAESDIRKYLNDYFWNNAFTDEEKKRVINSSVEEDIEELKKIYDTHGWRWDPVTKMIKPSKDNVFLLSVGEVEKYLTSEERAYGNRTGCNGHSCTDCYKYGKQYGTCWWLRTRDINTTNVAWKIYYNNAVSTNGVSGKISIRPAMYLKSL